MPQCPRIHRRDGSWATRRVWTPIYGDTTCTTGTSPLTKTTPIHGRVNLTLRAEAFNLFNRTQFGMPNTQVTTAAQSNLGRVTSQSNQPRLIQLAFRLTF